MPKACSLAPSILYKFPLVPSTLKPIKLFISDVRKQKTNQKTKGQRHLLETKNICSHSTQSVHKTITSTATGTKGEVRAPITLNAAPLVDTSTQSQDRDAEINANRRQ